MAVVIRRPTGVDPVRIPHRSIVALLRPVAVVIQIFIADDGIRDVLRGSELLFMLVALHGPLIEVVGLGRGLDVIGDLVGT
jgi:hypothetical protein